MKFKRTIQSVQRTAPPSRNGTRSSRGPGLMNRDIRHRGEGGGKKIPGPKAQPEGRCSKLAFSNPSQPVGDIFRPAAQLSEGLARDPNSKWSASKSDQKKKANPCPKNPPPQEYIGETMEGQELQGGGAICRKPSPGRAMSSGRAPVWIEDEESDSRRPPCAVRSESARANVCCRYPPPRGVPVNIWGPPPAENSGKSIPREQEDKARDVHPFFRRKEATPPPSMPVTIKVMSQRGERCARAPQFTKAESKKSKAKKSRQGASNAFVSRSPATRLRLRKIMNAAEQPFQFATAWAPGDSGPRGSRGGQK